LAKNFHSALPNQVVDHDKFLRELADESDGVRTNRWTKKWLRVEEERSAQRRAGRKPTFDFMTALTDGLRRTANLLSEEQFQIAIRLAIPNAVDQLARERTIPSITHTGPSQEYDSFTEDLADVICQQCPRGFLHQIANTEQLTTVFKQIQSKIDSKFEEELEDGCWSRKFVSRLVRRKAERKAQAQQGKAATVDFMTVFQYDFPWKMSHFQMQIFFEKSLFFLLDRIIDTGHFKRESVLNFDDEKVHDYARKYICSSPSDAEKAALEPILSNWTDVAQGRFSAARRLQFFVAFEDVRSYQPDLFSAEGDLEEQTHLIKEAMSGHLFGHAREFKTCPILQVPLDQDAVHLSCNKNHQYNRSAIEQWLKENNTCPECRKIVDEKLHPVHEIVEDLEPQETEFLLAVRQSEAGHKDNASLGPKEYMRFFEPTAEEVANKYSWSLRAHFYDFLKHRPEPPVETPDEKAVREADDKKRQEQSRLEKQAKKLAQAQAEKEPVAKQREENSKQQQQTQGIVNTAKDSELSERQERFFTAVEEIRAFQPELFTKGGNAEDLAEKITAAMSGHIFGSAREDSECPVCFEPLDERAVRTACCKQPFIKDALVDWIQRDAGCPICRRALDLEKAEPVYAKVDRLNESEIRFLDALRESKAGDSSNVALKPEDFLRFFEPKDSDGASRNVFDDYYKFLKSRIVGTEAV